MVSRPRTLGVIVRLRLNRKFLWERLARRPNGSVDEGLFLPDRNCGLERVDQPAAGFEGRRAMRAGYNDQHACLADFEASQAVHDTHLSNGEASACLAGKLAHLPQG